MLIGSISNSATSNIQSNQSFHPFFINSRLNKRLSMHLTSSILEKQFLKKWIKGLQICCSTNKQMNVMERKKRIKLSADIAMASAKETSTSWSNAIISNTMKNNKQDTILVNKLLGPESQLKLQKIRDQKMVTFHKRIQCKKSLIRSCIPRKRSMNKKTISRSNSAAVIAKRLVKKRTKVLKRLVPGGKCMDELSLIKEALDYILSLKVQVDVMRSVVTATEILSNDRLMKSV